MTELNWVELPMEYWTYIALFNHRILIILSKPKQVPSLSNGAL